MKKMGKNLLVNSIYWPIVQYFIKGKWYKIEDTHKAEDHKEEARHATTKAIYQTVGV